MQPLSLSISEQQKSLTEAAAQDFVGSETCVTKLQAIAGRGFTVQAHAGDLPRGEQWGGSGQGNQCVDGDTNSMAAFLVAAEPFSFYHCSFANTTAGGTIWSSAATWPAVHDSWLSWLPEYDFPLGAPNGPATSVPSHHNLTGVVHTSACNQPFTALRIHTDRAVQQQSPHVWTRTFASGTTAVFDGGSGQGTIRWAHGKTQVGLPYTNASVARLVAEQGCRWEDV